MTATYTVPPSTRAIGDTGHTGDHDNFAAVLAAIPSVVNNVLNTAYAGGADRTGTNDSTAAFQAALGAILAAGGGVLYIPAGDYKLTSGLTYSGTAPLRITGDGPQASNIRLDSTSAGVTYLSITNTGSISERGNDGTVVIENLSFYNDHYAGAFSDSNIALYLDTVNYGKIANVSVYKGAASQRINQGIVLNACNYIDIDNCDIYAAVNGIAVTGFSQVNNIRSTTIWTPAGTGVSTAACVLYQGQTLTAHMSQVVFHDGDRGIYWTQDSDGKVPHAFFGYDIEPNNHSIASMEFDHGAQVYLTQCLFSAATSIISAPVPGIVFGSGFQGSAFIDSCAFNGQQGHSVEISGGTGFIFTGCEFGGNGTYKHAADTFDEISIAAGVAQVTIDACHFNVDALAGTGTANPPRSAVYVASGASRITVTNSKGAGPSGYGTSAIVDNANAVLHKGNIGLGLAETTTGGGSTVTAATFANLGTPLVIPANDATVGTVYKMTCFGTGTEATGTAAGLSVSTTVGGASLGVFSPAVLPAAGGSFAWRYECHLYVTATGTSGSVAPSEVFTWGVPGGPAAPTLNGGAARALNTTQANQLVLTAEWGSAAGSPTITCACTVLERLSSIPAS